MKQLLVISGKGGTGKTSVTGCFACLAENSVLVDCDVDAANLYLLADPTVRSREDFYSGFEAGVNARLCNGCGLCVSLCRFDAILAEKQDARLRVAVDPLKCEGCGVCADHCPQQAVTLSDRLCGALYVSDTRFGPFVHAKLGAGGENSGKLVTAVRTRAKEIATSRNHELVLIDGPPGIGCPVIASVGGVDYALVVTEPTVSGVHDLERVVELLKHFSVPGGVIINKSDLNKYQSERICSLAEANGLAMLGELPYDNAFTQAQREAKPLVEYAPESELAESIRRIWGRVQSVLLENECKTTNESGM